MMKIDKASCIHLGTYTLIMVMIFMMIVIHGIEIADYKAKLEDREARVSRLETKLDDIHRAVCGPSR